MAGGGIQHAISAYVKGLKIWFPAAEARILCA
jgi:hypothetical protein